jgi:hypothetical protein
LVYPNYEFIAGRGAETVCPCLLFQSARSLVSRETRSRTRRLETERNLQCGSRRYGACGNDHVLEQYCVLLVQPGERVRTASPNYLDLKVTQIAPFPVIEVLVAADDERL